MGDTLTYAAHRTLLPGQSLAREYSRKDITSFPATGTTNPGDVNKAALSEDLRPLAERRVRRLAAVGRGPGRPARILLARRSEAASLRGRRSPGIRVRKAGPPSANGRACH